MDAGHCAQYPAVMDAATTGAGDALLPAGCPTRRACGFQKMLSARIKRCVPPPDDLGGLACHLEDRSSRSAWLSEFGRRGRPIVAGRNVGRRYL